MKPLLPLVLIVCAAPAWAQNPLSVRVLDESGKPIEGAVVSARVVTDNAVKLAPQTADANGKVTFSMPNDKMGKPTVGAFIAGAKGYSFGGAAGKSGPLVAPLEIRLGRGQSWRGKVVDDKGQPLEGAQITIRGAIKDFESGSVLFFDDEKLRALYGAKSGADGTFEIAGLPADSDLLYVVTRPNFARFLGQDATAGVAELVKLKPAGSLKGRALDATGKPLAKIKVYARSDNYRNDGGEATTEADGSFNIEGLASDTYYVRAILPDDTSFVMPILKSQRVEANQATTAGVWRGQPAVEIRGFVIDAATKKPLVGAQFAAQNPTDREKNTDSVWGTSDATGHFVLHVLPGQYRVRVGGAPDGYLRADTIQSAQPKDDAPAQIRFELQSAPIVRGIARDESGAPIRAQLIVGAGSVGRTLETDAQGKWQFTPNDADDITFGGGADDDGYFEIVSPKRVDWPVKGPIVITVRHKPWQTLEGRIVTPAGTPVEGVKVEAEFTVQTSDNGGYGVKVSAVSDADGRYKLERLRDSRQPDVMGTEVEVSAKKEGYQFQSGGKVTRVGDKPVVSNFVLAPLSAQISGTTRAGASVVVAGLETRADAAGHFAFEALPAGKNTVYAAQDDLFGSAPTTKSPLEIELQRPTLQNRDQAFARQLWAQTTADDALNGAENLDDWLAKLDFAQRLKRAQASGEAWKIAEALSQWKPGDSLETLRAGLEAMAPSEQRTASFLEAAITANDAALTARALEVADRQFEMPTANVLWREPQLYQVAVLTERRDGAEAGAFALRSALAYTLKNHPAKSRVEGAMQTAVGRNEAFASAASLVAAGSPAMLRELLESIETDSGFEVRARSEAIPVIARAHGFDAAVPWLEELQKMPAPTLDTERAYLSFDVDWAFGQAVHDIIPLIGATDPARAVEWAQKVEGDEQRARALASAARFQTPAVAAPLLREAVAKIDSEDAPRVAAWAWERDPQLGLELFEVARQKADDDMNGPRNYRNAWIPFAFYFARANPAQARLILEREWARSRQAKADADVLATIALAMTPIDAHRAAAMADELAANGNGWGADARIKIARYLVADDATRRGFTLNRIGTREAWDAGALQW